MFAISISFYQCKKYKIFLVFDLALKVPLPIVMIAFIIFVLSFEVCYRKDFSIRDLPNSCKKGSHRVSDQLSILGMEMYHLSPFNSYGTFGTKIDI